MLLGSAAGWGVVGQFDLGGWFDELRQACRVVGQVTPVVVGQIDGHALGGGILLPQMSR